MRAPTPEGGGWGYRGRGYRANGSSLTATPTACLGESSPNWSPERLRQALVARSLPQSRLRTRSRPDRLSLMPNSVYRQCPHGQGSLVRLDLCVN